jgi:hypothetical protein
MTIPSGEFWSEIVAKGRSNANLKRKAEHLIGYVIEFLIDDASAIFEFHRGNISLLSAAPIQGISARVTGPAAEWQRIFDGEIPFIRAINGLHGRLKFEGRPLENTWASPALGEFLKIAASKDKTHG